jgi:hypothetical protein
MTAITAVEYDQGCEHPGAVTVSGYVGDGPCSEPRKLPVKVVLA